MRGRVAILRKAAALAWLCLAFVGTRAVSAAARNGGAR